MLSVNFGSAPWVLGFSLLGDMVDTKEVSMVAIGATALLSGMVDENAELYVLLQSMLLYSLLLLEGSARFWRVKISHTEDPQKPLGFANVKWFSEEVFVSRVNLPA